MIKAILGVVGGSSWVIWAIAGMFPDNMTHTPRRKERRSIRRMEIKHGDVLSGRI